MHLHSEFDKKKKNKKPVKKDYDLKKPTIQHMQQA